MFNFNNMANKASRMLNKVGFQVKKYSPEILICAGVIAVGYSVNVVIMFRIPHFHNFVAGKQDDPVLPNG